MKAGADLKADHRVIRRLEATLRAMAAKIAKGESISPDDVEEAIKLMLEFVDSYHHAKEEAGLFPVIQGAAKDQQKVVYGFLVEHEFARRAARRIEQEFAIWTKEGNDVEPLSRFLLTYADFLKTHTEKEDRWFVEVDAKLLSAEQQREVLGRFAEVSEGRPFSKRDFVRRVNGLARKYVV
jgi:hemerythrin-like domain-containing protein